MVKRSFSLAGHRTSVALEPEFWSALTRIAAQRAQRLSGLVATADGARDTTQPLASALRVMALQTLDPTTPSAEAPAGAPADAANGTEPGSHRAGEPPPETAAEPAGGSSGEPEAA